MDNQKAKFDHWAIIELFGHSKIAGRCTEENIAGTNMLRVDVPETKNQPAFTKYYGSAAIYAINPVDEKTAIMAAENVQVAPISVWQGEEFTNKFLANQPKKILPPLGDEVKDAVFEKDDLEF
jgi:hypothetical protein